MYLCILHSKIVLPTTVCVLDSTVLRKCINKIVCNLQREKIIFSTSARGKTMKKLVKCVVATHETVPGMNAIPVTSEMLVFCPLHCKLYTSYLGSRQTRASFSKKIFFLTPHTEHVSLVQFNLCRV